VLWQLLVHQALDCFAAGQVDEQQLCSLQKLLTVMMAAMQYTKQAIAEVTSARVLLQQSLALVSYQWYDAPQLFQTLTIVPFAALKSDTHCWSTVTMRVTRLLRILNTNNKRSSAAPQRVT
jgi:hypothetical protein